LTQYRINVNYDSHTISYKIKEGISRSVIQTVVK
jgi:hypothetical protein